MNSVKLQDTKSIYGNVLYFCKLTMNFLKVKLKEQPHLHASKRIKCLGINQYTENYDIEERN